MDARAGSSTGAMALPWTDRPAPPPTSASQPRSERDHEILRGLVARIPAGDAGAHNNLGVVYYQKGMYADAAALFERALELDPRLQVAERNLQIVYFGTDHFDASLRELHSRLESRPGDRAARAQLARMLMFGGDAGAAIREWRRLVAERPGDVSALRWIARAELRRGDTDAAVAVLAEAAQAHPSDAHVLLQLGEILFQKGLAAEARDRLERCLALDATLAGAHHLLAFVCGELGDDERAAGHASRAAELNPSFARMDRSLSLDRFGGHGGAPPGDREGRLAVAEGGGLVHYNMGLALRQKALYEEATREFRLAAERGEDRFLVSQAESEMMLLQERGEAAIRRYRELIEEEPASPKLWNELGVAHHQQGLLGEARESYERAIELDTDYSLAWNNLGIVRHHLGQPGTVEALESALERGRSVAEIWRNLGWFRHLSRQAAEAERAYRRALDADPRLASAWTGLGMLYLEQSQPDQAARSLARAIECDASSAEAHYHFAFALSAVGDYPGALRAARRALELNPYLSLPRFRLLIDLQFENASVPAPDLDAPARLRGEPPVSEFEFDPGVLDDALSPVPVAGGAEPDGQRQRPSTAAASEWLSAARGALEAGEHGEALSSVQRATGLGANRLEAEVLQGEIHLAAGAAGEAIERFERALSELDAQPDPGEAVLDVADLRRRSLAGLARGCLELDRLAQAVDAAERHLALARHDAQAAVLLADALEASGDARRAVAVLELALKDRPDSPHLLTRLGAACVASGDLARAEPVLRQAIGANGDLPAARAALGRLLVAVGRPDEAIAQFRTALSSIPSFAEAALGLADLLSEWGRTDEAMDTLVEFLEVDPYHFGALVRLGDLLWRTGRQTEAGVAYRRILRFDPGHSEAREGLERLDPAESADPDWITTTVH